MIKDMGFDMNKDVSLQEARWLIVKAMSDEFPELRERAKKYLRIENCPELVRFCELLCKTC